MRSLRARARGHAKGLFFHHFIRIEISWGSAEKFIKIRPTVAELSVKILKFAAKHGWHDHEHKYKLHSSSFPKVSRKDKSGVDKNSDIQVIYVSRVGGSFHKSSAAIY